MALNSLHFNAQYSLRNQLQGIFCLSILYILPVRKNSSSTCFFMGSVLKIHSHSMIYLKIFTLQCSTMDQTRISWFVLRHRKAYEDGQFCFHVLKTAWPNLCFMKPNGLGSKIFWWNKNISVLFGSMNGKVPFIC